MTDAPFTYSRIAAWLEVNGTPIPIKALQVDYELNSIPQATCVPAIGREGFTSTPSPIHSQLLSIVEPQPAKLKVNVSSRFGVDKSLGVPNGPFTLFNGYTSDFSYNKNMEPPVADFQLPLRHWLTNLDYSSVFSAWSHPSNPARYSAYAVYKNNGPGIQIGYQGPFDRSGAITDANVAKDIWGAVLKPFFLALAAQDGLAVPEQQLISTVPNTIAKTALGAINTYPQASSLSLNFGGDTNLAALIVKDLNTLLTTENSLVNNTIWGVLVGACASEYLFAVVPRINDALVVPFVAGLANAFVAIGPDELAGVSASGAIPRPIRAFGIMSGFRTTAGTNGLPPSDADSVGAMVGGWFAVPNRKIGMVRIERPPRWAGGAMGAVNYVQKASGAFKGLIGVADQPDAAGPPNQQIKQKLATTNKNTTLFLQRYAQSRLVQEHGNGRQAVLTGPFRMDIAPGSCISFKGTTDPFLQNDQLNSTFYGTVLRVSHSINVETKEAWTSFHVSHLRTLVQNFSRGYSVTTHPLYSQSYVGAPLYDPKVAEFKDAQG